MDEAEAWATETRRRMRSGTHVSTREAEALTLADAFEGYQKEKLDSENSNHCKDRISSSLILSPSARWRFCVPPTSLPIATR